MAGKEIDGGRQGRRAAVAPVATVIPSTSIAPDVVLAVAAIKTLCDQLSVDR